MVKTQDLLILGGSVSFVDVLDAAVHSYPFLLATNAITYSLIICKCCSYYFLEVGPAATWKAVVDSQTPNESCRDDDLL